MRVNDIKAKVCCPCSSVLPGGKSLPEDLLRTGPAVRRDGGNRPGRVRLPGEVPALVRAGVRLRRQVLREPLRGVPHRLPGEETHLRGPQQGLLLQRYSDFYGGWGGPNLPAGLHRRGRGLARMQIFAVLMPFFFGLNDVLTPGEHYGAT